jgi:predicted nucleic acid-binding protein
MTAIIDTGPLAGLANSRDPQHFRSKRLLHQVFTGQYGTPVSLDLVLLEGLTLIQKRRPDIRISHLYASYFHGAQAKHEPPLKMRSSGDLIELATENHFRYFDRGLSTVDAALLALTQMTNGVLITFDKAFEGLVPIVSE